MSEQNNPKIDFGFHAVIPRIIRTDYKTLTPMQKWLYVCLKDLCGDHGTCYRSLRVLSEETGISTGMLSESIPVLHEAGLVHAEKKRRTTGGKEVWHITIIDIWKANAIAHSTKRSQNEQTLENVHTVNNNVHRMNKLSEERSQNEQERSLCETEVITLSNTNTKAITEKKESGVSASVPIRINVVTANADDALPQSSLSDKKETEAAPTTQITSVANTPDIKVTRPAAAGTRKPTPLVSNEEKALRKQTHEWVNRRRGYSIQGRGTDVQCRQENQACNVLASMLYRGSQGDPEGTTLEELDKEWDHIAKYDRYWSKDENKPRIGAQAILQMHAQTISTIRKKAQSKTATQTGSPTRQLTELEKSNREKQARYARAN